MLADPIVRASLEFYKALFVLILSTSLALALVGLTPTRAAVVARALLQYDRTCWADGVFCAPLLRVDTHTLVPAAAVERVWAFAVALLVAPIVASATWFTTIVGLAVHLAVGAR